MATVTLKYTISAFQQFSVNTHPSLQGHSLCFREMLAIYSNSVKVLHPGEWERTRQYVGLHFFWRSQGDSDMAYRYRAQVTDPT